VAVGQELREERDAASWALGDLLVHVCTPSPNGGRPSTFTEGVTLTAFAHDINEARQRCSGLYGNALFYPQAERRKFPPHLAWYQFAKARSDSGWRPGQGKPTLNQRAYARELLFRWAEDAPEPGRRASSETPVNGALPVWVLGHDPLPDGAAVVCLPGPAGDWEGKYIRIRVVKT